MGKVAFTAPHAEAARVGAEILEDGGNAVDAVVAAAAMVAVQYPHMNSLGGDGFWLIQKKGEAPVAIDACGYAAKNATPEHFFAKSQTAIPERGPSAALTMAGTVAGWELARIYISEYSQLSDLSDVFAPAISAAKTGISVTQSMHEALLKCLPLFADFDAFNSIYKPEGKILEVGDLVQNPALASLLEELADHGLDAFYRGRIAEVLAEDLSKAGSVIRLDDFHCYRAKLEEPLTITNSKGQFYNLGAPTQGIASLIILAIFDRLYTSDMSEVETLHLLVEATKQAFLVRDREVTDPENVTDRWLDLLSDDYIEGLSRHVSMAKAATWPNNSELGDTVWMGAVDRYGTMVSFIQSIYWEFGSGLVLPTYGLLWNNRGVSFSLDTQSINALAPRKKPRHTLNPAMANLNNGDRLVYGTMGGEGQPQTQAAIMCRHLYQGHKLTESIAQPRWLLGRTWGDQSTNLKIEASLFNRVNKPLQALGHDTECVSDTNEMMGHAGAIRLNVNESISAASDPRSDGAAIIKKINP